MARINHTMGQDWGGRRRLNPENCPTITRSMVILRAAELGIKVRRGHILSEHAFQNSERGTWWAYSYDKKQWLTIGDTNFLALSWLNGQGQHGKKEQT